MHKKNLTKTAHHANHETVNKTVNFYIHTNKHTNILIEITTKTNFASHNKNLKKFTNNITLQIATINPQYINIENIPTKIIKNKTTITKTNIPKKKPTNIIEKIMQNRLDKFYTNNILTHQTLFINESHKIQDYLNKLITKVKKKIKITQFMKIQINQPTAHSNIV